MKSKLPFFNLMIFSILIGLSRNTDPQFLILLVISMILSTHWLLFKYQKFYIYGLIPMILGSYYLFSELVNRNILGVILIATGVIVQVYLQIKREH